MTSEPRVIPTWRRPGPNHGPAARSAKAALTSRQRAITGLLLAWWVFHVARIVYARSPDLTRALETSETGSLINQADVLLLGLLGASVLPAAIQFLRRAKCGWVYWFLAYLIWSAISLYWSVEAQLTIRRFLALLFTCVGAIGLGAGFYGRTPEGPLLLLRHVRWAGIIAAALAAPVLLSELSWENLSNPAWRTSLVDSGPEVGFAIAYALIGCLAFLSQSGYAKSGRHGDLFIKVSAAGLFVTLILLKSRSLIAGTALCIALIYAVSRKRTRRFVAGMTIGIAATLAIVPLVIAYQDKIVEFYSRGNDSVALRELNGRVRIWDYVENDIAQRPWTGVGFGAYWSSARLPAVWRAAGWSAPCTHNGYLDELVATGIIGVVLLLGFTVSALRALWRRSKGPNGLPAKIAIGWFAMFLFLNGIDSIFQFYFRAPFFFTMALLSACSAAATSVRPAIAWKGQPASPEMRHAVVGRQEGALRWRG